MTIALYLNDLGFTNLDLRNPIYGNEGIGGTQYCFVMLADALIKYTDTRVVLYHYNYNTFPNGVLDRRIEAREQIFSFLKSDGVDIIIFKAEGITDFVKMLRKSDIKSIVWAHNYIFADELREYTDNHAISRVVFVGHEMYDRYIDHPILSKATFVYNMFDGRVFPQRELPLVPSVTYMGSLIPAKGFHILAEAWKDIVKRVPGAQLYVIGDGKLYNRKTELGPYGIAENEYENSFMRYLTDNGRIMDSVHFMGTMGKEKVQILKKTTVGVMNPSGRTETFGLSAIEMSACGIPVVTKKANGLFDTVKDGKTGYLVKSRNSLKRRITRLLTDNTLNIQVGKAGKEFANAAFLPESIIKEWTDIFECILLEKMSEPIKHSSHLANNAKWIRIINSKIQKCGLKTIPLIDLECSLKRVKSLLKRSIWQKKT